MSLRNRGESKKSSNDLHLGLGSDADVRMCGCAYVTREISSQSTGYYQALRVRSLTRIRPESASKIGGASPSLFISFFPATVLPSRPHGDECADSIQQHCRANLRVVVLFSMPKDGC